MHSQLLEATGDFTKVLKSRNLMRCGFFVLNEGTCLPYVVANVVVLFVYIVYYMEER